MSSSLLSSLLELPANLGFFLAGGTAWPDFLVEGMGVSLDFFLAEGVAWPGFLDKGVAWFVFFDEGAALATGEDVQAYIWKFFTKV